MDILSIVFLWCSMSLRVMAPKGNGKNTPEANVGAGARNPNLVQVDIGAMMNQILQAV